MNDGGDKRVVRIVLGGGSTQGRMNLRRILMGMPGMDVIGHVRAGPSADDGFRRVQSDVALIDGGDDPEGAKAVLQSALRHEQKVLVLIVDGQGLIGRGFEHAPSLVRPANLDRETASSPFGISLQKKLIGFQSIPAKPNGLPPVFERGPRLKSRPELIAIGSSTGGPQALPEVLSGIAGRISQAIVITQHMPAAFTRMLASHLSRYTMHPAVEAADGMPIQPGYVYLAPGGKHFLVVKKSEQLVCQLDDGPEENFCRPAVDPMLRSVTRAVGGKVLAVILTGMGQDGLAGCRTLVEAGGAVIAQDEATSVVWGMPGAVANAGICRAVLPLNRIADEIISAAGIDI